MGFGWSWVLNFGLRDWAPLFEYWNLCCYSSQTSGSSHRTLKYSDWTWACFHSNICLQPYYSYDRSRLVAKICWSGCLPSWLRLTDSSWTYAEWCTWRAREHSPHCQLTAFSAYLSEILDPAGSIDRNSWPVILKEPAAEASSSSSDRCRAQWTICDHCSGYNSTVSYGSSSQSSTATTPSAALPEVASSNRQGNSPSSSTTFATFATMTSSNRTFISSKYGCPSPINIKLMNQSKSFE